MNQLGYKTLDEDMSLRFKQIEMDPNYHTLVAKIEGKVVGMIGLHKGIFYERNGIYVRITAFVINEEYRGNGFGRKLIQEAELWAKNQGALAIGLTSGKRKERELAHLFYRKMGYLDKSIGFGKELI
jgi:GNAT superfamily N-acetyltransferase